MRILYGVSGEGFGHSSRAKEIIKFLMKNGHKVKILTYGQAFDVLSREFDAQKIEGMHIFFKNGQIDLMKTISINAKNFSKNFRRINSIRKLIKKFKPDICITDMEVITPMISNLYKLPLISIDNQHRFTNAKITVPGKYKKDFLVAKAIIGRFVKRADYFIVLSFSDLLLTKKRTFVVGPILREEVRKLNPKYGKKILVYLTKKDSKTIEILKNIKVEFIVYGFEIEKKESNIVYKKFGPSFLKDLESCGAVIGTSGFSLISEALFLRKPYFALPLHGQFEQAFNALVLKQSGYGDYSDSASAKKIRSFISNLDLYRNNLKGYKPDSGEVLRLLGILLGSFPYKE